MKSKHTQNSLSTNSDAFVYVKPSTRELVFLIGAVVCCYSILYGPQVLLNRWIDRYMISSVQASSLVYAPLIPMSIAPLSYGLLLGVRDTRRIILWALGTLILVTALLTFVESYFFIMLCRLMQGVSLPAVLIAIMARFSATGRTEGPRLITYYLCATVIGGLTGRLITGYVADTLGLVAVWWVWTSVITMITFSFAFLPTCRVSFNAHTTSLHALRRALTLPSVRSILLCGALMFGGFAAALNLLPLRANSLGINSGSTAIAHRYWGYLSGVLVALNAQRIDVMLKGGGRAPAVGLIVMAGSLLWGTLSLSYAPLSVMVLGLCIGLFITHPLLTAYITQLNPAERGLMSGLYLSSYYIGGAMGSWLAGMYLTHVGWDITLITLAFILTMASGLIYLTLQDAKELIT